jgi:hypothetical protein
MTNPYLVEALVRDRLEEARAWTAQAALAAEHRSPTPGLRVALGLALIRIGRALAGSELTKARRPDRVAA